jgi:hypothetical protein
MTREECKGLSILRHSELHSLHNESLQFSIGAHTSIMNGKVDVFIGILIMLLKPNYALAGICLQFKRTEAIYVQMDTN